MLTKLTKSRVKVSVRESGAKAWADWSAVGRIEHASYPDWRTEPEMRAEFARYPHRLWVAEVSLWPHPAVVVGYAIVRLCRDGATFCLSRLAVDPPWRRCGVGSELVEAVIGACEQGAHTGVHFSVRESDLAAQLFLRACGVECHHVLPDWFGDEPAYWFCEYMDGRGPALEVSAGPNRLLRLSSPPSI